MSMLWCGGGIYKNMLDKNKLIKNTQIYILDLDGTIYSRREKIFEKIEKRTTQLFCRYVDNESFQRLEHQYPNPLVAMKVLAIDKKQYFDTVYNQDLNYNESLKKNTILKDIFMKLNERGVKFYIVTLASYKHAQRVLEILDIKNQITGIFCGEVMDDTYKYGKYQEILEKNNISRRRALVVGDSYASDIIPAKKLKIPYIWLNDNKKNLEQILDENYLEKGN